MDGSGKCKLLSMPPSTGSIRIQHLKRTGPLLRLITLKQTDNLVEETDNLVEETDNLVEETDNMVEETDNMVEKTDNLVEETDKIWYRKLTIW